jgi:formylglycine-generating enzyme required for sulfatase activity
MEVMGSNPSQRVGNNLPVEKISWYDAIEYCNRRSLREGLVPVYRIDKTKKDSHNANPEDVVKWTVGVDWKANGYRLPTEAEWEFAAKGGKKSFGYKYSGSNDISQIAWHFENSGNKTNPVGSKAANVWEWCWDWYGESFYSASPEADPIGEENGSKRVLRGGSWLYYGHACRTTRRFANDPHQAMSSNGFRVVRSRN